MSLRLLNRVASAVNRIPSAIRCHASNPKNIIQRGMSKKGKSSCCGDQFHEECCKKKERKKCPEKKQEKKQPCPDPCKGGRCKHKE